MYIHCVYFTTCNTILHFISILYLLFSCRLEVPITVKLEEYLKGLSCPLSYAGKLLSCNNGISRYLVRTHLILDTLGL